MQLAQPLCFARSILYLLPINHRKHIQLSRRLHVWITRRDAPETKTGRLKRSPGGTRLEPLLRLACLKQFLPCDIDAEVHYGLTEGQGVGTPGAVSQVALLVLLWVRSVI